MRIVMHERWKCIGCGACTAVSPDFWEMSDDGFADLKGCDKQETPEGTLETRALRPSEVEQNQNAADSCPVECIFLKNK